MNKLSQLIGAQRMNIAQAKQTIDYTVGTGGVTSPAWLPLLNEIAALVALYGGAVLVLIRIAIAIKEWNQRRK
jgi:O-glycosyl hydrolase